MEIREIDNKDVWERFLEQYKEKTFLSSWNWGQFQKKIEEKIWRLGIYNNQELVAVALVIKIKSKRGTFLFIPHGPILKELNFLKILLGRLKKLAKQEKASFIRIAPIYSRTEENIKVFKDLGFRDAPIHIHPENTWELDIDSSEQEILMGMRKTTRYLIRRAEKNPDIEIVKSQNIKDLKKFHVIYEKTSQRHRFMPFSLNYLENQLSCFLPDNILIFLGKYKGNLISSAVVVFWQGVGFYHHGASLYNKIPVSYLLQWKAIKEAKAKGCQKYNFWGIAPKDKKNHPWAGLTLFKKGFGGYKKEYVKTQDLPLSISYYLTYIFEKIRKIKRGL